MKKIILFVPLLIIGYCFSQNCRQLITQAGTADDYSHYGSVIIFDSTKVIMEESGLSNVSNHKLIKILTYQGAKENSVFKIDYDPLSALVEIQKIILYKKEGTQEVIDNRILDYAAPARMIYWGARQKMVEIGRLEPGDAIEIYTHRKGYTYALLQQKDPDERYIPPMRGHFYDIVPFWSTVPVITKSYSVSVLKTKLLQYGVFNGEVACAVTFDTRNNRINYFFTKKNITPLRTSPYTLSNNDIQTKLVLSTAEDWYQKSKWFYGVNEDYGSFSTTPELNKKVRELLKSAKTELDSISVLTHWVADNMRYSGISMGEGEGYTLHNAKTNFTDRCGVCKDKASLLIAMLRAAGFESYAAMTMAGERIENIPADQFNHSVTIVKRRNGDLQLLDPTWVPGVRELWSSAEQQQNYLIGKPDGADLMVTPVSAPDNHYVKITNQSHLKEDGTLSGIITITAEGQSDRSVRGVFNSRREDWYNNVEMELLKIAPNAVISKMEYTDENSYLTHPVTISYSYSIPRYAVVGNGEMLFVPLTAKPFFSRALPHLSYNTDIDKRDFPFRDRCSRLVEITETVVLPNKYNVVSLPDNRSVEGENIRFNGQYRIQNKTLHFSETASFGKRIYEASEWEDFKNAVKAERHYADEMIILKK